MLRRLPIESAEPAQLLAAFRLALAAGSLVLPLALGLPYDAKVAAVLAVGAVPWALALLVLVVREPKRALHPALAAGGVATLVVATAVRGDTPVTGSLLAFYEAAFAVASVGAALIVGRLRTTESASRLRARGLTRRTLDAEREIRRCVAEALHDGAIQELIGLDMLLATARQAAERGDSERLESLLADARELVSRNVRTLRDEIVDLDPFAFDEMTYEGALDNCVPTWERRYGIDVNLGIDRAELSPSVAGDLFNITQEAVVNAGRHSGARTVTIDLRSRDGGLELRIADDGQGFGASPWRFGAGAPGARRHARASRAPGRGARDRILRMGDDCGGPRAGRPPARAQIQPRSVAMRTACARSTAPSLA